DDMLSKPYTLEECAQVVRRFGVRGAIAASTRAPSDPLASVDAAAVATLRRLRSDERVDLYSKLVELFQAGSAPALAQLAAALDAALSQDVAIVLLDVDMPGMDGNSVCRRLRAESRFATVPIVMVTGHEDSPAITRAFEAGATDFISKPVNWALLPRRLEYIL